MLSFFFLQLKNTLFFGIDVFYIFFKKYTNKNSGVKQKPKAKSQKPKVVKIKTNEMEKANTIDCKLSQGELIDLISL